MKQQVKYGLTTRLVPYDEPEVWDGTETLRTAGLTDATPVHERPHAFADLAATNRYAFTVPAKTSGTVTISRAVTGNCASDTTIIVQPGCDVLITEQITGSGSLASAVTLLVAPTSKVRYAVLQDMGEDSLVLLDYEGRTERSGIEWFACLVGGRTTRARIATLAGASSTVSNRAVIAGAGEQQFDIHAQTVHSGEASASDMLTRAVLTDRARAVMHGLIRINAGAKGVDSFQKAEAILLSDTAGADAIPNLEILDHRVTCSHGASIGKVDDEQLFYLESRGVEKQAAKRMIVEGFLDELFPVPWQAKVHDKISRS